MFKQNPIKLIKGLFYNYRDNQDVNASEYNGNIVALKTAIEHNGAILEEHDQALEALLDSKIPVESVDTDKLMDNAVTLSKLAPEARLDKTLFKADCFNDLLTQFHRKDFGIYGTFMNGTISKTNATGVTVVDFIKTIERLKGCVKYREYNDGTYSYSDWVTVSKWLSEENVTDYSLKNLDLDARQMTQMECEWATTYFFNTAVDFDADTNFDFYWTFNTAAGSRYRNLSGTTEEVTGESKIEKIEILFEDSDTFTNLPNHLSAGFTETVKCPDSYNRPGTTERKLSWNKSQTYSAVKAVRITTRCYLYVGAISNREDKCYTLSWEGHSPGVQGRLDSVDAYNYYNIGLKNFNVSHTSGASNTVYLQSLQAADTASLHKAILGIRVQSNDGALDSANLMLVPSIAAATNYANAIIGHLAVGEAPDAKPACPDTLNTLFTVEDATNKIYFITQEYIPPLVISGVAGADAIIPDGWHDAGRALSAGTRYFWQYMPNSTDKTYIYPNNMQNAINALIEAGFSDVQWQHYTSSAFFNEVFLNFNVLDVTVKDFSLVRVPLEMPEISTNTVEEPISYDE